MFVSIDSNITVGIINTKDRLHKDSLRVIEIIKKGSHDLILSQASVKETSRLFLNNINNVIVRLIKIIPDLLEIEDSTSIEFNELLLKKIKELKKKGVNSNFCDLMYSEIQSFLKKNPVKKLPNFLSGYAIYLTSSIDKEIKKITGIDFQIVGPRNDIGNRLDETTRKLVDVRFKDKSDERIFYEIVFNLDIISPVNFVSDDKEAIKKSNKAKAILDDDTEFSKFSYTFLELNDFLKKNS